MKLSHKLCGAALLAVVGVAVALPNGTKADNGSAKQYNGEGKIEFAVDSSGSSDNPHIPGESSELSLRPNPDKGDLMILGASPLDFDKNKLIQQGAAGTMRPYQVKRYTDPSGVVTENFVELKDARYDTLDHKYTLTAQLTKQFTHGTNNQAILKGAEITYSNAKLMSAFSNDAYKPEGLETTFTLSPAADGTSAGPAVTVIKNGNADKGLGYWDVAFGNKASAATATDSPEQSVVLNVPADLALLSGSYSSTILWTITEGVTP